MAFSNVNTAIVEWVLVGIALIFVILRLWVRGWLQGRLALSDFLIIVGWISFVGATVVDLLLWQWGVWDVDFNFGGTKAPDFEALFPNIKVQLRVMKLLYASIMPWLACLYCVKASFLLFYLQLFPPLLKKLRLALYFTIAFTSVGFVVSVSMNLFWCSPLDSNWAIKQSDACLSFSALPPYFTSLAFHFISDCLVYALPFFLLRHLLLSRRKVIGLVLIFSLGGVAIACTIVRTIVVGASTRLPPVALWGSAEQGAGIVVACCPPLKWLWQKRPRSVAHTSTGGGRSRTAYTGSESKGKKSLTFATMDPDDGYDLGFVLNTMRDSVQLQSLASDTLGRADSATLHAERGGDEGEVVVTEDGGDQGGTRRPHVRINDDEEMVIRSV